MGAEPLLARPRRMPGRGNRHIGIPTRGRCRPGRSDAWPRRSRQSAKLGVLHAKEVSVGGFDQSRLLGGRIGQGGGKERGVSAPCRVSPGGVTRASRWAWTQARPVLSRCPRPGSRPRRRAWRPRGVSATAGRFACPTVPVVVADADPTIGVPCSCGPWNTRSARMSRTVPSIARITSSGPYFSIMRTATARSVPAGSSSAYSTTCCQVVNAVSSGWPAGRPASVRRPRRAPASLCRRQRDAPWDQRRERRGADLSSRRWTGTVPRRHR